MGYYPFPRINTISHQPVDNKLSSLLLFSESVTKCTYAAMLPDLKEMLVTILGITCQSMARCMASMSPLGQDHYTAMVDPCIYHICLLLPRILLLWQWLPHQRDISNPCCLLMP